MLCISMNRHHDFSSPVFGSFDSKTFAIGSVAKVYFIMFILNFLYWRKQ